MIWLSLCRRLSRILGRDSVKRLFQTPIISVLSHGNSRRLIQTILLCTPSLLPIIVAFSIWRIRGQNLPRSNSHGRPSCLKGYICSVFSSTWSSRAMATFQCRTHFGYTSTAALVEKTPLLLLNSICRTCTCQSNAN